MPNASLWSIPEHLYPHVLQYLGVQDLVNLTSVGPLPTALIRAARGWCRVLRRRHVLCLTLPRLSLSEAGLRLAGWCSGRIGCCAMPVAIDCFTHARTLATVSSFAAHGAHACALARLQGRAWRRSSSKTRHSPRRSTTPWLTCCARASAPCAHATIPAGVHTPTHAQASPHGWTERQPCRAAAQRQEARARARAQLCPMNEGVCISAGRARWCAYT